MESEQPESVEAQTPRVDRRRRRAHDPAMPITVNISRALLAELDAFVVEQRGTRSGAINMAIREWLARQRGRAAEARLRVKVRVVEFRRIATES